MLRVFTHVWGKQVMSAQRCTFSALSGNSVLGNEFNIPEPELDLEFLCDMKNKSEIEENIRMRQGVANIQRIHQLYKRLHAEELTKQEEQTILKELNNEAVMIPNMSYPPLKEYGETPKVVKLINQKREFSFKPREFHEIAKKLSLIRTENLGYFVGQRGYYLLGDLAELEEALVTFSLRNLIQKKFQVVSVPDVLPRKIIENCGMNTRGPRTQVYELDPELHDPDFCLSGTSEMALAAFLMNKTLHANQLPLRLAAVSRCYRAEVSSIANEKGIYRVHQFTKVEMFGAATEEQSTDLLEEFRDIQEHSFASLGLHTQTLDMPLFELGAPAYRKYDVEAWLPGRRLYGEVSSCSNCTDYQSRRLNIKYQQSNSDDLLRHVHTVNGTACAIPRMLISLLETHQQEDGTVLVPELLQPYMQGKTVITNQKDIPKLTFIKSKHWEKKYIKKETCKS